MRDENQQPSGLLSLDLLLADIADYAKTKIEDGDIAGPRFGALVKLAWCCTSGEPCYSGCCTILQGLEQLRELADEPDLSAFHVAMTAAMTAHFPDGDTYPSDFDALRQLSAEIGKVASVA